MKYMQKTKKIGGKYELCAEFFSRSQAVILQNGWKY